MVPVNREIESPGGYRKLRHGQSKIANPIDSGHRVAAPG